MKILLKRKSYWHYRVLKEQPKAKIYLGKLKRFSIHTTYIGVNCVVLFGSTYTVEQLFSRMKIIKSKQKSVLSDHNLKTSLRLATTSIETDFERIMKSND